MHHEKFVVGLEQLARQMHGSARAAGSEIELAGRAAGGRHQPLDVLDRRVAADYQHRGRVGDMHYRHEVLVDLIAQAAVKVRVGRQRELPQQQGIAVGRGARGSVVAYIGAATRAVVDDEGLAGALGELVGDQAGHIIAPAAGREGHDDGDRLRGVGRLGVGGQRHAHGSHGDGACEQRAPAHG